jgi:hypothetical protein
MASGGGGSAGSEQGTGGGSATGGTGGIAGSRPGGTGGASSGGTAGSETGGTAGAGGTGGATGGTAGQGGTGGSTGGSGGSAGASGGAGGATGGTAGQGGNGGTVVLDPPGPGIACGETTCAEDSEMCCVGESDPWCDASQCQGAIARLECDDSADCPGERCCYTNISAANWIWTLCGGECGSVYDIQVCKEAGECDNGDPCHVFVCGGLDTRNVVIGLCTATAPENCE